MSTTTFSTVLKNPLHLWIARIISLAMILTSIGIGVLSLPKVLDKVRHDGIADVYWELNQNGEAIIQYLGPTAQQNGVAIGDKILNYKVDISGKFGTTVTLHIQSGSSS